MSDFSTEHVDRLEDEGRDIALNYLLPSVTAALASEHPGFNWRPVSESSIATIENDGLLWYSISLTNEIDSEQEVLIEFANFDGAGWLDDSDASDIKFMQSDYAKRLGGRVIFDRYFVMPVTLQAKETRQISGFVYSISAPRAGQFRFWNPEVFREKRSTQFFVSGAYYGFILTLFLYNIALFYTMRQSSYLYGGVFVLAVGTVVFFNSNYATILLFPNNISYVVPAYSLSMLVAMFSSALLSISVLKLPQTHPTLYKVWVANAVWSFFQIPLVFWSVPTGYEVNSYQIIVYVYSLIFLFMQGVHLYTLYYFWRRSSIIKYWFVVVTLQVWMLVAIPIAHNIGYLDATNFLYALQFFSIVNGVILTSIISNTVRREQRLRFQSQANALENLQTAKDIEKSKSNFVNTVGHDLKQPLEAMRHHLEHLKGLIPQESHHILSKIERNSGEINSLLGSLMNVSLSTSEIDGAEIVPFQLQDVLNNLEDEIKPFCEQKGIQLSIPTTFLSLNTSRVGLSQILRNLLTNSVKFTESGSISILVIESGAIAKIQVTDTGCGIPEEELAQVFNEFYQVGERRLDPVSGMGLGLSIVDRLSKSLSIPISVKSTVNQGTCFELQVDIADKFTELGTTNSRSTLLDGLKVAIISTNSISNSNLKELLVEWGALPIAHEDLESSQAYMDEQLWLPDMLILSDKVYGDLLPAMRSHTTAVQAGGNDLFLLDENSLKDVPILILHEAASTLLNAVGEERRPSRNLQENPLHCWFESPIQPGILRAFIQRVVVNAS